MGKEKENKSAKIEIRLTPTERAKVEEYAEAHYLSMSQAIRIFIIEALNKKKY